MNISSIGGVAGSTGIGGANQTDFRTRMEQAMAPVAQLFGMTSDRLMSAVKASGGSLSDYAASKGISNADLTAAIKQGLQNDAPNGAQLSDTQLTNLAQRIENHKPGDRRHGSSAVGATGGATSTGATSTGATSTTKTDLEKLIADLKALESASTDGSTSTTSTAATTATNSVSTNALLDVLTQFDQQG